MKWCYACKRYREFEDFYSSKNHKDGLKAECKDCSKSYFREYAKKNRKKRNESRKKWLKKGDNHKKALGWIKRWKVAQKSNKSI